jgi:hypothetical protein
VVNRHWSLGKPNIGTTDDDYDQHDDDHEKNIPLAVIPDLIGNPALPINRVRCGLDTRL